MALLSSSSIRFRAIEPEDLDILYHWENNTAFWEVGVTLAPFSKYILRQYITESHKDIYELRQVRFIIELSNTHTPIGLADLFDFDPHNSRAAIGILIDTPFQKKGYAKQALALLEEYAFSFLKILSGYRSKNSGPASMLTLSSTRASGAASWMKSSSFSSRVKSNFPFPR